MYVRGPILFDDPYIGTDAPEEIYDTGEIPTFKVEVRDWRLWAFLGILAVVIFSTNPRPAKKAE